MRIELLRQDDIAFPAAPSPMAVVLTCYMQDEGPIEEDDVPVGGHASIAWEGTRMSSGDHVTKFEHANEHLAQGDTSRSNKPC